QTEEFQRYVEDEFPNRADLLRRMDRRQFMTLAGAAMALAGMSGCRWLPQEKAVPQVKAPEEYIPGKPIYYASAFPFRGYGLGVLVESHEGRPTKIEGNPDHPSSLGRTDAITQASILTLYDPDRARNVKQENDIRTWEAFLSAVQPELEKQKAKGGTGLRVLTETVTSPALAAQIRALRQIYPQMRWHQYEPFNSDNAYAGAEQAFGRPLHVIYDFRQASRVVSLDADFLSGLPGSVRYAWDFAEARRVREDKREMNRLYVFESTPSPTGAVADHRRPVRASDVAAVAAALAARLGVKTGRSDIPLPKGVTPELLDAVARDLQSARGSSVIVAGEQQPPSVHALAHLMNVALGNVGRTVRYTEPIEVEVVNQLDSLRALVADMQEGRVDLLLILGGNPVYTAPADLNFGQQLIKVPLRVHLSLYEDETSALCQWHLPEAHYLEAWGDIRAHDGTVSIVQPLIQPLYEGKSALEVLSLLAGQPRDGYEIVRTHWLRERGLKPGEWDQALNRGVIAGTQARTVEPDVRANVSLTLAEPGNPEELEVIFRPDPYVWDGRYANNAWLQELARPLTKLTWDNAILMSPNTARRLGLNSEDVAVIRFRDLPRQEDGSPAPPLQAPVLISIGHPEGSITLPLGYGRTRAGNVGTGVGFNAYVLRTTQALDFAPGATLRPAGRQYALATTEHHHLIDQKTNRVDSQDNRPIIRVGDIGVFQRDPTLGFRSGHGGSAHAGAGHGESAVAAGAAAAGEHGNGHGGAHGGEHSATKETSLYPDVVGGKDDLFPRPDQSFDYSDPNYNQWAMVIDLNTCVGCGACMAACIAENNIPAVGKTEVKRGREMYWIRVDTYYQGPVENPRTYFQPVNCMHCELAPCEPVCPVAATVHSHEGLNQMVYNRCIGTKYCSNNCPYKVRRFNFLNYANDFTHPVLMLQKNPDVTVRGRGVMEKCTYCVQRISEARIEAKKAGRKIGGNEVVTACQQVCPTNAIIFGDKNQPDSEVAKAIAQGHNYALLEELNTRPRTTYLARLRNPNPEIGEEA
ncbi:MAG: Fe-S-cluster-containing hydrogenase, partial [Chthonomonadaceae bacterium]|nr:Fe-S-cluster-containing hydrogenase [Chthonomonadaceae bacterium]